MKTIDAIKVIICNTNDTNEEIVMQFQNLPGKKYFWYATDEELQHIVVELKEQGFSSKEVLIIKPFWGRFFQMCPGTPEMICCNYRLINTGFNCLYNCAYCYLQVYLNSFGIMQFSNMTAVCEELDTFISTMDPFHVYRIGTGEFTDSLMMDRTTGISEMLIEKLASYPNLMLELKTKSNNIDHLLDIQNKGNTVFAWSLNTPRNIKDYEEDTASLEERLRAAKKAAQAGYYLAFHFDPVIMYPGWKDDYLALLEQLFSCIDHTRIVWISLGGFRYTPSFKEVLRDNFPHERMTLEEMFPGKDGKYRYLKHDRQEMYCFMKKNIEKYTSYPFIYMCMESAAMWNAVFGKNYSNSDDLEFEFAHYLHDRFLSI